mgnify:FL=1
MTAPARHLAWRLGRRLYCAARGEQRRDVIARNGEAMLQRRAIAATGAARPFTVLDIGANRGDWTASLLAELPPARRAPGRLALHAFEPVRETAALFRDRIDASGGAVTLHETALSDSCGEAEIALAGPGAGTSSLHPPEPGLERRRVPRTPLSALADRLGLAHIHLAKSDTEGHDLRVLAGARPLLEAGRIDLFQFEYNHRWIFARAFLRDVFALIDGLDYRLVRIDPAACTVFDAWHPELDRFFQSNYALVHARALGWLPLRHGRFDRFNVYA